MSCRKKTFIRPILITSTCLTIIIIGCTYKSNDWVRPAGTSQAQQEDALADCEAQSEKYAVPIFGINITGGVTESWSKRKYVVECMHRKGFELAGSESEQRENK
jgi:hypothetical protein